MEHLLNEIEEHLKQLFEDPTRNIDRDLLESFNSKYIESIEFKRCNGLVKKLAAVLPNLQQDPTPVAGLAIALIDSNDQMSFTDVLALEPRVDFVAGLESRLPAFNELTLSLLAKASTASDAGIVAGDPKVVVTLVNLWLRTKLTVVAERSRRVLVKLLETEASDAEGAMETDQTHVPVPTPGLMWRRVFNDKDIYGLLYSLCSNKTLAEPGQLSRREKTIAQGRLLDFIQDIAYAPQPWESQDSAIEKQYGVEAGSGLIDFATARMVDYKDDALMHTVLVNFFTNFISKEDGDIVARNSTRAMGINPNSSKYLDFLLSRRLHARTMLYFLEPERYDPLDVALLYSSSTEYIATYANHYRTHFLENASEKVISRLTVIMQNTPTNIWASMRAPTHDLKLLASLPQRALLWVDRGELMLQIPMKPANADALRTLASIIRGPNDSKHAEDLDIVIPPRTSSAQTEIDFSKDDQIAARVLFLLYIGKHPNFWLDLVSTAERIAVKETAMAAIGVIEAVVEASWAAPPDAHQESTGSTSLFPSEEQLRARCPSYDSPLPRTGPVAVLSDPAIGTVLPYLMKPAQNSSETAWELAVLKFDALRSLRQKLQKMAETDDPDTRQNWNDLVAAIQKREADGPAGRRGQSMRLPTATVATVNR